MSLFLHRRHSVGFDFGRDAPDVDVSVETGTKRQLLQVWWPPDVWFVRVIVERVTPTKRSR